MMSFSDTLNVLLAELHREGLIRVRRQAVEERRLDRRRLLADDAGERGALGAVALAGGAQAAEQVHLEAGGLRELVGRQLRAALIEVVGDAHRADRVRARGPGADLVELFERGHHRPLGLLDDLEVGRHLRGGHGRRVAAERGGLFRGRRGAAGDDRRGADDGAAHQERPAVDACRESRARPVGGPAGNEGPVHPSRNSSGSLLTLPEARGSRRQTNSKARSLRPADVAGRKRQASGSFQGSVRQWRTCRRQRISALPELLRTCGATARRHADTFQVGCEARRPTPVRICCAGRPFQGRHFQVVRLEVEGRAAAAACTRRSFLPRDWLESTGSRGSTPPDAA